MRRWNAWIVATALVIALPSPAVAQDDWSVEGGNARQREIVKRYKTLLERTPTEGLAFKRLLDYVGKGKGLESLVAEYSAKVQASPDKVAFRLILGHLHKAQNDYQRAFEQYDKAVALAPDDPNTWLSRGAVHLLLQHADLATADFEKALDLEKNKDRKQEILRRLADTAFAQRDWERAQKYYDDLVSLDPRNEYLRMEYAQVLIQYKRFDKALEQYEKLVELAGRDTKARATTLRDMGDLYEKMGRDDDAIATYEKALKLVREGNWLHREVQQRIVGVYRRADRLAELVEAYEKRWRSLNYDQAMMLGTLYDELGREDEALAAFTTASKRNSRAVDPRLRIIRIKERRGDDAGVIAAYNKLIGIAPREPRYQFDLVRLHFRLGNKKAAQALLKKIEARFSRDADVFQMLADTYMRFDMRDEALKTYRRLVRMDPKNDAYILGLGEYYYQGGELDDAVKTWVKLLDSSLGEAEAHAKLGQVLSEHGLVERGLQHFEKAAEVAPADLGVRRGLALAYARAHRWNQAVETWTHILNETDQPLSAQEARTQIIGIYQRQNKLRGKMREFSAALKANPDDFHAAFFLAEAQLKLADYDGAEGTLSAIAKRARGHDPEELAPSASATPSRQTWLRIEESALLSLEKLYNQNSNLEAAIAVLQRLAELRPARSRDYYHRIAELSLRVYRDDQAVHYATLAVQMNPDDANAQARLGDVYKDLGKLEAAAAQYRQAIDLDPRALEIAVQLAEILLELGKFEEAEALYRDVTKRSTEETLVRKAAQRAMALAELADRLEDLEAEFFPLVYKSPPRPVYRKIMLELYERLSAGYVSLDRYGVRAEREEAARKLDEIGQRALPVLVDALNSDEVSQRALAVHLLGDFRQGNAALPLSRMVDEPSEPLRMLAATAVAQVGDPRGAGPLIRATEDSDPAIRAASIWALGSVGGQASVERLAAILTAGQTWHEQALAAISLGRIGTAAATDALLEAHKSLATVENTVVAVIWGLGRSGDVRATPVLVDSLTKGSQKVAEVAAWSLAQLDGEAPLEALLTTYLSHTASRDRAGRALVQLASRPANRPPNDRRRLEEIRSEIRFIDDRNASVNTEALLEDLERRSAIVVPGGFGDFVHANRNTIGRVVRQQLSNPATAALTARILVDEAANPTLGVLSPAVTDPGQRAKFSVAIREVVADSAAQLRDLASRPSAPGIYAAVLASQGQSGDLPLVLSASRSGDLETRSIATAALGHFRDRRAFDALREALGSQEFTLRLSAARALGNAARDGRDAEVTRALIDALGDDYASVQVEVARALGKLGEPAAVPALAKKLLESPIFVKVACLEALRSIDTDEARKARAKYAAHPDPRVREAATR